MSTARNKTVLITGTSSGIGRATANRFHRQGWNVAATLRSPEKEIELSKLPGVLVTALDVTRPETIESAIQAATERFGEIDAVVNNAGYGLMGPFELATHEQIERQFATNVFGMMNVTRAILPGFRKRRSGVIVNVASVGGRVTFPLYSLYHASKWAVEGFSESLQYELGPFGIQVKIVEPGAIQTDFNSRSADRVSIEPDSDYREYASRVLGKIDEAARNASSPELVAETIFRAATDGSCKLRYPVGMDARMMLALRSVAPDTLFMRAVRSAVAA